MHKTFAAAAFAALLSIPAAAQALAQTTTSGHPTAAELLQKGIFAQETAGDLEGAAKIYRQIVDSHPIQRDIAAQAQYRLGMTLLQKGDAALASQEIQRLGWDFPDYKELISSAKANGAPRPGIFFFSGNSEAIKQAPARQMELDQAAAADVAKKAALESRGAEFDFNKSVKVVGKVSTIQIISPTAWLTVNPTEINGPMASATGPIRVALASPKALVADGWDGLTSGLLSTGQITVIGAPARDGTPTLQATSVTVNGEVLFLYNATR